MELTFFECRWKELRWVLRWIFITQWTVLRSDLRSSRDNYAVNLMSLCLNRGSCRQPLHSRRDAPSVAVTIRCTTIAGSTWLWTYSRVELEPCHFFFNILLEWSVPLAENILANDRKDDRGQQNFKDALSEFVQFELNILQFLLSLIQLLFFFWRPYTVFFVTFCSSFFLLFFFQEKSILPIYFLLKPILNVKSGSWYFFCQTKMF